MKKKLQYRIEQFHIKDLINKKYCYIQGWCYSPEEVGLEYGIRINDKDVDFYIDHVYRNDVTANILDVDSKKIGFTIYVFFEEIHSFLFYVKSSMQKYDLIVLNEDEVNQSMEVNSIDYRVSEATFSKENSMFYIVGWAASTLGKVEYEILDEKNCSVPFEVEIVNRFDLVQLQLVDENNSLCGFQLKFNAVANGKYRLILKDSQYIQEEILDVENNNGVTILRNYFKALNASNIKRALKYFQDQGIRQFLKRVKEGPNGKTFKYQNWFNEHKATDEELAKQRVEKFSYNPKISIIVATFNTAEEYLKEMIDTVVDQTYPNWELCIGDGSTTNFVEEYIKYNYKNEIRIKFKRLEENYGISGNMNGALSLATGDYVALYDHDDLLTPDALYEVVKALQDYPYDIVYTDEDKLDNDRKELIDPHFKPDFSIDLLRSQNYICHFLVVNKTIVDEIGGLHSEYDGSQDLDYVLRCYEKANGVYHIPKILYHWRMHPQSTALNPESKMYCYEAGKRAIQDHYDRVGIAAHVEMMPKPLYGMYQSTYNVKEHSKISIVAINDAEAKDVSSLITSIREKSDYANIEFIIVNNSISKFISVSEDVKVLEWDKERNYSKMYNFAVNHANGEYLLFLRSKMMLDSKTAISQMLGVCQRPDIGAVNGKVIGIDDTIINAGIIFEKGGVVKYCYSGQDKESNGYMCHPKLLCNYSILSGMNLMVKKVDFLSVGGFDEQYYLGFYDLDFCIKLRIQGKLNTYNGFSHWRYNVRNLIMGYEAADVKKDKEALNEEYNLFRKNQFDFLNKVDPFYSPNFSTKYDAYTIAD
ncbi:MAG: glycosyltransferase [Faecalicoccus sp.]|uniref:glycosyltransferase family 2 protein n=1 Tax=Faecalicoccus sp. TaxID=1971758 RepID=UPI002A91B027|nr:glycosyltransferase [Faecalicoccus sp.]MDY5232861.1 glycosyltransferase [Faecalicoccus sp.]